jgi:transposase-like protein
MQSSEGAFGLHRFATNFIAAFRNTRIRIPPDPEQAYRRSCPAGTAPHIDAVRAHRTDAGERAVTDPSRHAETLAFQASRRSGSDDPRAVRASTCLTTVGNVRARSPPRGDVGCRPDRAEMPFSSDATELASRAPHRRPQIEASGNIAIPASSLVMAPYPSGERPGRITRHVVEVMGRYSNPDNVSRLNRILAGQGRDRPSHRPVPSLKQKQTRLRPEAVDRAVARYLEGATLKEVAAEFGVNRYTVANHLERRGIRRRMKCVPAEQVEIAAKLYGQGLSLNEVADRVGSNRSTIRRALLAAGLPTRPRRGWSYL